MGMSMVTKNKCKTCGKYETRQKEVKSVKIFDDVEVAAFHIWKWCKLHNNWCRNHYLFFIQRSLITIVIIMKGKTR